MKINNIYQLRKYVSSQEFWMNSSSHHLLIYGNERYGRHVISALLEGLPCITMELRSDEVKRYPHGVISRLMTLCEEYYFHKGAFLILHEGVVKCLEQNWELTETVEYLYRTGRPRRMGVITVHKGKMPGIILEQDIQFFICSHRHKKYLIRQCLKSKGNIENRVVIYEPPEMFFSSFVLETFVLLKSFFKRVKETDYYSYWR